MSDLVRDLLTEVLRRTKDPRLQRFFTITEVDVSPDLKHARVFVSVLGGQEDKTEVIRGLQSAGGFLRHEVGERAKLRYTPELEFRLDDSIERGDRVLRLLKEIEEGEGEASGSSPKEG